MWLLNTETAILKFFNGPDDTRLRDDGGYVILSHVWQEEEQTFQGIMALNSHTPASDDDTPRSRASLKIRDCCMLAASHGYRWVWIDTCCINKDSSAELSEAINLMFEWYRRAAVCYVYLFDVSVNDLEMEDKSMFYNSKWLTRGWTLQELIAPLTVLFLLRDWTVLGTKMSLVDRLSRITSIDEDVLLHRRQLGEVSISTRMSWASRRKTTRAEDEAYCLMGIFGVNMPTIYGEGQSAFYRLQEEIMKISSDQTLFAWDPRGAIPELELLLRDIGFWSNGRAKSNIGSIHSYLLASSPSNFGHNLKCKPIRIADAMKAAKDTCTNLASLDLLQFEVKTTTPSPSNTALAKLRMSEFTITSHGMRSTVPVIEFEKVLAGEGNHGDGNNEDSTLDHSDHQSRQYDRLSIAVLGCKEIRTGAVIGLVLDPLSSSRQLEHVENGVYEIGLATAPAEIFRCEYKLVVLGSLSTRKSSPEKPVLSAAQLEVHRRAYLTWATVYIIHRPLPNMIQTTGTSMWGSIGKHDTVVFQFSRWSITELAKYGLQVCPSFADSPRLDAIIPIWLGGMKYSITFTSNAIKGEAFTVVLDQCICSMPEGHSAFDKFKHWENNWLRADVTFSAKNLKPAEPWVDSRHGITSTETALGNCSLGHFHIGGHPNWMKKFGSTDRIIELTFNLHKASEKARQYICLLDIKLAGSVYMSLLKRAQLASKAESSSSHRCAPNNSSPPFQPLVQPLVTLAPYAYPTQPYPSTNYGAGTYQANANAQVLPLSGYGDGSQHAHVSGSLYAYPTQSYPSMHHGAGMYQVNANAQTLPWSGQGGGVQHTRVSGSSYTYPTQSYPSTHNETGMYQMNDNVQALPWYGHGHGAASFPYGRSG